MIRPDHIIEDALAIFERVGGSNWYSKMVTGANLVLVVLIVVAVSAAVVLARRGR